MSLVSLLLLALYVFLQSAPTFGWFAVDPKLTAFIGIVFVVIVILEIILSRTGHLPRFLRHGETA